MLVAAAGLIVGAFLPWVTAGIFSVAGTDGDGVFTLVIGGIVGVLGFLKRPNGTRLINGISAVLFALALLIAFNIVVNIDDGIGTVGGGLVLTILAGIVGMGAAAFNFRR
jgi:hypothetical protein